LGRKEREQRGIGGDEGMETREWMKGRKRGEGKLKEKECNVKEE
jgi:hypothetical protein